MADFVVLYAVSSRLCSAMTGGRRYNPMWFFIKANQSKSSFVAVVRHPVADAFIRTRSDLLNSTPQFLEFTLNAPSALSRYMPLSPLQTLSISLAYLPVRENYAVHSKSPDVRFTSKADIAERD